jgi:hypothetical protein
MHTRKQEANLTGGEKRSWISGLPWLGRWAAFLVAGDHAPCCPNAMRTAAHRHLPPCTAIVNPCQTAREA